MWRERENSPPANAPDFFINHQCINHKSLTMRPEQKRLLKIGCVATVGLFVALLSLALMLSPQLRQRVEQRLHPSDTVQQKADTANRSR